MKVQTTIKTKTVPEYAAVLRTRREDLKLNQSDVAEKLGISPMGLSHYENGVRFPNITRLDQWASFLGLEVNLSLKEKKPLENK